MKNQGYLKLGLVIGLLLVLTGARSAPAASVTGCGTWRVIQSPNPTPTVILSGVAAISANNVWAVGRFTSDSNPSPRALALQWDGTHWQVGALPNPGTTEDAFLAVTRVSASQELWAVGYENSSPIGPPPVPQTLIEHWDGTSWSVTPSPNVGQDVNELYGVTATSPTDAWAVGEHFDPNVSTAPQTLTEHWDGTSWSVVPSPSPGTSDNALTAVTAVAANDIWAVGHMQPGSSGIQNASLVEHWDGSQWLVVSSPNVGSRDNLLSGVAADSASSAWAVGTADGDVGPTTTFILHWNGSQWAVTPSPSPGSSINALAAPVALSATNAWAVGYFQQANRSQRTLTEHWNGKNWKVVNSPNIGTDNNDLNALAFIAGTNQVWTVGEHFSSDTGTSASLTLFRC